MKFDDKFVTLYSIHVTKNDNTGYWKHFLMEDVASQEFWKALRDNYGQINMKKERFLRNEIPVELLSVIRKLEKEQRDLEAKKLELEKPVEVEPN